MTRSMFNIFAMHSASFRLVTPERLITLSLLINEIAVRLTYNPGTRKNENFLKCSVSMFSFRWIPPETLTPSFVTFALPIQCNTAMPKKKITVEDGIKTNTTYEKLENPPVSRPIQIRITSKTISNLSELRNQCFQLGKYTFSYIRSIIASANSRVPTSVAPSIARAKS
jgi:hypothetical protein